MSETETENPIVTIARLIDPEAWAHAEEYAAVMNTLPHPFFEQQVQRLTKRSMEAAIRVIQHLQPKDQVPDVLSEVTKPAKPNRKTRRSTQRLKPKDTDNEG